MDPQLHSGEHRMDYMENHPNICPPVRHCEVCMCLVIKRAPYPLYVLYIAGTHKYAGAAVLTSAASGDQIVPVKGTDLESLVKVDPHYVEPREGGKSGRSAVDPGHLLAL